MIVFRRASIATAAVIVGCGIADAQQPIVLQKLTEWNQAAPPPSQQAMIAEIARASARVYAAKPGCAKSAITLGQIAPATADRRVFNGVVQARAKNGWTVVVTHPACDDVPVRYMIVEDAGGALTTFRVNRGQSNASESLIGDTFPLAMLSAYGVLKRAKITCNDDGNAKLGVTRIEAEESGLGPDVFGVRYAGSWSEIWPVSMCGETVEVPIRFTADGDGGAYTNIKGDSVKRIGTAAKQP